MRTSTESEDVAEFHIEDVLWGYPDLRKKFHEVVRPAWIDAREKRRKERVEGKQRALTTECISSDSQNLVSEVTGQDEGDTAVLHQSNEDTPLGNGSGHSAVTQADVHPNSPGQLIEQLPPADEHPRLAPLRYTVAPGPALTAQKSLSDARGPVIGKEVTMLHENEEVTSTSGSKIEKETGECIWTLQKRYVQSLIR